MNTAYAGMSPLGARRRFLKQAGAGTLVTALGGLTYVVAGDGATRAARAQTLADGRPRLPAGQKVLQALKPMGGRPGAPGRARFRLKVHGEVDQPFELDFNQLLALPVVERALDVHCVTGWSVLGARFRGVPLPELARRAKVRGSARHLIIEAAHGYTANVRLDEALVDDNLLAFEHDGRALARRHGSPVRAVIPKLYFWKSAKYVVGLRFARRDEPGYWETRGYHNHADPWKEERYA
ncbi:MAG: molybdopterin-binding oxidoreductase [Myxococcales bacterium FL481]|nr:MAG: molybdopterin-binding oxidoreductase [Myxococcales bacterium FL481]